MKKLLFIYSCFLIWNSVFGQENIIYPPELTAIVDITKPPYNADNTGKTDCSPIINKAIDDIIRPDLEALKKTIEIVQGDRKDVHRIMEVEFEERQRIRKENPEAIIGRERCAATFAYKNPLTKILYFPNGIYKVSNTLTYSFKDLKNRSGKEYNHCLHFQGQSEKGTIIRLADHSNGFGKGKEKPVISFTNGNPSNVSMQNTCENMTIEIGEGNPGAIGLVFYANNTGAARHITVRSLDPNYTGNTGAAITTNNSSCVLFQHLTIEGCDFGIKIIGDRLYTVLEHINLRHQRKAGFYLKDHNVAARKFFSNNSVPAIVMEGEATTMALLDCEFINGDKSQTAIELNGGFLYARNIDTKGYNGSLKRNNKIELKDYFIKEYVSHTCPTLYDQQVQKSLQLLIEETPEVPWEQDFSKWISVNEFGAKADGFNDDTKAIQAAMNSGQPIVYFQPGIYLLNGTITVPAHVQRINFMYCDFVAGPSLQDHEGIGAFKVVGNSENPLLIEDLFAFELYFGQHYLIDHASKRTIILSDMQTQIGAMYKNSVQGGKVFIENVASTDQYFPYGNCFTFKGQKVWARQLNPERANPQVYNKGSDVWVLGFKTEKTGMGFLTTHGGRTEILGGIFNNNRSEDSSPIIKTIDSEVSVFASTTDHRIRPKEWNKRPFIEDTKHEVTKVLIWDQFPMRSEELIVVPLFSNQIK